MDSVEWRASSGWNDEQMIHFVKTYNNRTCPLEGDLVEVAVKHGLTVFLDFLLDEEDEVLEQKHMKVAITMISKFRTQRKVTMLKYLVGRDLKVNGYVRGMSYLAHEVACGNVTVVRTLLGLGANVNAKDNKGYTPLMACKDAPTKKIIPLMKLLLRHGADERIVQGEIHNESPILNTCLSAGSRCPLYLGSAVLLSTSVANWRQKKDFSLVSNAFLGVKLQMDNLKSKSNTTSKSKTKIMAKFKTKMKSKSKTKSKTKSKSKKKSRKSKNRKLHWLELHGDVLGVVYSFL